MASINKQVLVGRLGRDPEVRTLESGEKVANFTVATTETSKDRTTGEKKETTEWHNVVLFKGLAETAAKYLKKGEQIYIEGRTRHRTYEKDGITRYVTEVIGNDMVMLTPKNTPVGVNNGATVGNGSELPF